MRSRIIIDAKVIRRSMQTNFFVLFSDKCCEMFPKQIGSLLTSKGFAVKSVSLLPLAKI